MILYHFTQAANLFHVALDGLEPHASPNNGFMTGDVPVVWLTREESNLATADDVSHVLRVAGVQMKEGDLLYGGNVRLAVQVERHDKRLIRYSDFCIKSGAAKFQKSITPKSWAAWWLYLGLIPPRKIDLRISRDAAIECLDHHIETHPDFEARAKFKTQRQQVMALTKDETVQFGIE